MAEEITITFTRDTRPLEKDGDPFFEGKTVTLPKASADRWIKRSAAVVASPPEKTPGKAKK